MTAHIVCSTHDGASFIGPFVESLQRQTDGDWRLWLRDNDSADATPALVARLAAAEPRISIADHSREPLGVVATHARVLDLVPADADCIMLADQDDIWHPDKIAITRSAMRDAERAAPGPLLIHTDLSVVDADLNPVDESFWRHNRIDPAVVEFRQLVVRNNVTAGTVMFNRALRELIGHIPDGAAMHDWWAALVASAFGRIIALPRSTVLYRQHGANTVGALRPWSSMGPRDMIATAPTLAARTRRMRAVIAAAAMQAGLFHDRYGAKLNAGDREFLAAYSRIPQQGFFARKAALMRLLRLPGSSMLRNLSIALRA